MELAKMLEEEMERSTQFTRDNFGLKVGDTFPDVVRSVAASENIGMKLMINVVMGAMMGKSMTEDMPTAPGPSGKLDFSPLILKYLNAFELPISLLYWGIQIGRRMEREESEVLDKLSTQTQP